MWQVQKRTSDWILVQYYAVPTSKKCRENWILKLSASLPFTLQAISSIFQLSFGNKCVIVRPPQNTATLKTEWKIQEYANCLDANLVIISNQKIGAGEKGSSKALEISCANKESSATSATVHQKMFLPEALPVLRPIRRFMKRLIPSVGLSGS